MREHEQEVSKSGPPANSRTGRKRGAGRKSAAKSAAKRAPGRKKGPAEAVSVAVIACTEPDNTQVRNRGEAVEAAPSSPSPRNDQFADDYAPLPPAPDPFDPPAAQTADQTAMCETAGADQTPGNQELAHSPPYGFGFGSGEFAAPGDATAPQGNSVYQFEPAQHEPVDQARPGEMATSEALPETDTPPPPMAATATPGAPVDTRPLAPGIRPASPAGQADPPADRPQHPVTPPGPAVEDELAIDATLAHPAVEVAARSQTPPPPDRTWPVAQGLRLPPASNDDPKWSRPARQAVSDMLQSSTRPDNIETPSGPRLPAESGPGRTPFVLITVTGLVIAGFAGAIYWQLASDAVAPSVVMAPPPVPAIGNQAPAAPAGSGVAPAQSRSPQPSAPPHVVRQRHTIAARPVAPAHPAPRAASVASPLTPPGPALAKPLAPPVAANRSPAAPIAPAPAAQAELRAVDVAGVAGEPLLMPIAIGPADLTDVLAVRVTGLPDEVSLSAGRPAENGSWLLSPADLRDLTLSAPGSLFGMFKLGLSLLRTDGAPHPDVKRTIDVVIAEAPVSRIVTVEAASEARQAPTVRVEVPAPAPLRPPGVAQRQVPESRNVTALQPPSVQGRAGGAAQPDTVAGMPPSRPPTPPAGENFSALIARGDALIAAGDIASARLLYEHGANAGHVEAAMRLARACDPLFIRKLEVYGVQPDSRRALKWYRFAAENGNREAAIRLEKLKSWLAGLDRFSANRN